MLPRDSRDLCQGKQLLEVGAAHESKNQQEKAPGGNFRNPAGLEKTSFSQSMEEGEHLCTRISDDGHVFKSAVKLCYFSDGNVFCFPVTGAGLWLCPALQIVGIYWAWIHQS